MVFRTAAVRAQQQSGQNARKLTTAAAAVRQQGNLREKKVQQVRLNTRQEVQQLVGSGAFLFLLGFRGEK